MRTSFSSLYSFSDGRQHGDPRHAITEHAISFVIATSAKHFIQIRLRKSYNDVCKAVSYISSLLLVGTTAELPFLAKVAEFELTASTLRANSSALSLGKKLVTLSAPDVFEALKDFRPQPDVRCLNE